MPLGKADLDSNKVWSNALKEGELVFAMQQSKTPAFETPGPWGYAAGGYDGYCMGVVMQWLATRKLKNDFEFDKVSKIFNDPHWHATKLHNIYMKLPTGKVLANSGDMIKQDVRDTIREAGMLVQSVSTELTLNAKNIRTQLASKNGLCYITLFGHAIAAQNTGGSPRFFDPNYGHFRFTSFSRFEKWIDTFLIQSNYKNHFTKMKFYYVS